jgi:hypothetical protein
MQIKKEMFKIEHVPKETKNLETNEQSQRTFILIITFSYYLAVLSVPIGQ